MKRVPKNFIFLGLNFRALTTTLYLNHKSPNTTESNTSPTTGEEKPTKPESEKLKKFRAKLRETTPIGKLDELDSHPAQEQEPLKAWPNNTNPHTGEVGGPKGPEPTRYGDWERKGRVSDF